MPNLPLYLKSILTIISTPLFILSSIIIGIRTPVKDNVEIADKKLPVATQSFKSSTASVLITISATPTVTPAIAPRLAEYYPAEKQDPKIDCVGPDGKHLQITQKECNDFNNAWNGIRPTPTIDPNGWGIAQQISSHTWTMKVADDGQMAAPREIFAALNNYRQVQKRPQLSWNDNLAQFAQKRAQEQEKLGKTDEHAGFNSYVQNPDNLKNLGFWSVGENSSSGYVLSGVHLIEWVFASDEPHNDNQLNARWSAVGIGVDGTVVDIVFGGNN
ncbi:MAG: CAP domain-containing protein [Patescibacteria group bacterium]|nr:CAP domain-containing protein [Patescibacteria group bacterium]